MESRTGSKLPLFAIEALGSLATGFYGNFVFFRFRNDYGFGDLENLLSAALMGLVVALASWWGGKIAQRHGCFRCIAFGLVGLVLSLLTGFSFPQLPLQLLVLVTWTASQFVIWPALEALVTDGCVGNGRARIVGIYSVVWATCSALSYFFGGALFDRLGSLSIYWLPPFFHVVQLIIVWRAARNWRAAEQGTTEEPLTGAPDPREGQPSPRVFQKLAWIANPFACVAAFTLLALIPALSARLGLSVTEAGAFGSIWFFARLTAFAALWKWQGWHYRFGWLLAAYLLLMAGFFVTLTSGSLMWLAAGQIVFGLAVGMLYYSSLFYSMDVGESRAEQGGIHEAMMGAGNLIGPGVGALGLTVAPQFPNAGVWTVSGLLSVGLALLLAIRKSSGRTADSSDPAS